MKKIACDAFCVFVAALWCLFCCAVFIGAFVALMSLMPTGPVDTPSTSNPPHVVVVPHISEGHAR